MAARGSRGGARADGRRSWARARLARAGAVALGLGAGQVASMAVGSSILLAGPLDTLARLRELAAQPSFLATVGFSLVRIMSGFVVAYALAVALAFLARRLPLAGTLVAPVMTALKSVPIACVIVLLLIWVGSRRVSAIAVFVAVFPAVYFSCAEGLAGIDPKLSEMLAVFRVRGVVRALVHAWPSVLPHLVGTARNVCGMAWKAGVAAELIGSPRGSVGERIYQAKILLETADLFAWTILVVALSALCERLFVSLLSRSDVPSRRLALVLARGVRAPGGGGNALVPSSVTLDRASIGYGEIAVATGVSVDRGPGSRTVLTDRSGAGKTTLLRTVAGLQPVLDGQALLLPPTVSVVFQDARLVERLTAVDNVLLVAGAPPEGEVREALGELLPAEALDVPVAELSGGQRRRVEIVRALLCPSAAVLLDEPFSSLDERTHREAAAFVLRHLAGRTLMVASHAAGDAALLSADAIEPL